jgi:hypothetical protein
MPAARVGPRESSKDVVNVAQGTTEETAMTPRSQISKWLRWVLPFLVSAGFLYYVLSGIDLRAVGAEMTPRVAMIFIPSLLVFLAATLFIESLCLVIVISHVTPFRDLALAARIKAASYLLGMLNYALGAGALTVLVRRRAGLGLADAGGTVFVIGLFDLGSLVAAVTFGIALMGSETKGVQAGVVVLAAAAIVAGFVVLRAPIKMGPLDRIRDLQVFHAARTLPIHLLAQLGVLRVLFLSCFFALSGATLYAFDVHLPVLDLIVNVSIMLLVAALPIAAAGLGTGQLIFVALLERFAAAEPLLAASLTMSVGLIITRSLMGLIFAREFASEALAANREGEA